MNHRFESLDGLRGIFALSIAAYHFLVLWHLHNTAALDSSYMGVDFFFVLSGFVITHSSVGKLNTLRDGMSFGIRRFGRVWPLHMVMLLALVGNECFKLAVSHVSAITFNNPPFEASGNFSLSSIPANIFMLHGLGVLDKLTWNAPSWSIGSEFFTYLLFALACLALHKRLLWAAALLVAVSYATLYLTVPSIGTTYDYGFIRCIMGFFTGYLTYCVWQASPKLLRHPNLMETLSLCLLLLFPVFTYLGKSSLLAPLVMAVPVWVLAHQQGWMSALLLRRAPQRLGLWSYGIYMVHTFVLIVLSEAITALEKITHKSLHLTEIGRDGPHNVITFGNVWLNDALIVTYLLLVIATAALAYRVVEKPFRNAFNRVAKRVANTSIQLPLKGQGVLKPAVAAALLKAGS